MDNYTLMRLSNLEDEDAPDYDDIDRVSSIQSDTAAFKDKYKEFYSDIKTDIDEDW